MNVSEYYILCSIDRANKIYYVERKLFEVGSIEAHKAMCREFGIRYKVGREGYKIEILNASLLEENFICENEVSSDEKKM